VETVAALAHAEARRGNRDTAETLLEALIARSDRAYVSPTRLAVIHAGLRNVDAALGSLEEASRLRAVDLVWLRVWPWFESLRGKTRFEQVARAVGLEGPAPT